MAKIEINPIYELIENVKDFDGTPVSITIAVFDTPIMPGLIDIYSVAYILYDTGNRPDYEDKALYYGAPEFYPAKLTEEQAQRQMEFIKQNLENYKFKEV